MLFIAKLCIKNLIFGALHIAVLVSERAKKRIFLMFGRKVFWQLFLLSREKSCRYNDAKIRFLFVYMLQ